MEVLHPSLWLESSPKSAWVSVNSKSAADGAQRRGSERDRARVGDRGEIADTSCRAVIGTAMCAASVNRPVALLLNRFALEQPASIRASWTDAHQGAHVSSWETRQARVGTVDG